MNIKLKENEVIDDLECDGLKIIQNNKYFKFGIDAVLLSDFAKSIKKANTVMDIGTGTGIIPILLTKKIDANKIIGVEIQENVAEMANRSVNLNKLEDKIEILNKDIKEIDKIIEIGTIDAIVTNPPYQKENTGIKSEVMEECISRHEIKCNFKLICEKAFKLLKNNGEMYIIHRAERLSDVIYELKTHKLEPKLIRFVHSNVNSKPTLFLIKAVKNAKEFLKIEKNLIIYKEDGEYTDEILEIYGKK